jgi:hypothetical protein
MFLQGKHARRRGGKTADPVKGLSLMNDDTAGQESVKPRKRPAAKQSIRLASAKVKATIHLSVEASQRLDIHATMMGFDRSALVEKLINDHLRRYVVSDRSRAGDAASGEAAA